MTHFIEVNRAWEKIGAISAREFKASIRAMGLEVHKKDVERMFADLEKDVKQLVTFEEYVSVVKPMIPDRSEKEEIMKLFKLYDVDNTGKIALKNLKKITQDIGENITEEELETMLNEADLDGDGAISPEEFYRVIRRTYVEDLVEFE